MRPVPAFRTPRVLSVVVATALSTLSFSYTIAPAHAQVPATGYTHTTAAPSDTPISEAAASAKAVATGKAVQVDAATTPTESEAANPDGTFTLTQNVEPVRKRVDGSWKNLDSTLVRNSDGSISPAVSADPLTLSAGGTGALAQMRHLGQSLSLTLPSSFDTLPQPSLSGNTATYPEVLPGIDLQVSADTQGGFSEVLVVKSAAAAANPALAALNFTTAAKGVSLSTDAAGNLSASDGLGRPVFSAPAPRMWDSATASASAGTTQVAPLTQEQPAVSPDDVVIDPNTGEPAESSAQAPGEDAHVSPMAASYQANTLKLTPDPTLLSSSSTVYPLYIDPTYSSGGGTLQAWTYVDSYRSNDSFWKTTDSVGLRVGYQGWETPYYTARALMQMSVDSRIYGAEIVSSRFYATESYAATCTPTPVELWLISHSDKISTATTWNNQPTWSSELDSQTVAHGWPGGSCSSPGSVGWDATSAMRTAASGSWSYVTLGLRATHEDDKDAWKKFDHSTMSMSTTYDHKPGIPTALSTSPATTCTSSIKTVGNGDVALYAWVYDKDGGNLSTTFKVTKTATGAVVATKTVTVPSGHKANDTMKRADLDGWLSSSSPTELSWNVTVSDGSYTVGPSKTCSFTFDPTVPGAPQVADADGYDCGDSDSPATYQVGTLATLDVTPNLSGSTPASYLYQLNGAAPISASVTASDPTAAVSIHVKPTRQTNVLSVTAVSPGGNIGDTDTCILFASAPATAAQGDLTGDGVPDLAVVGGQDSLPAGLWQAHGAPNSKIITNAAQIGALGTGKNDVGTTADWTGTQAITGHFSTGAGFNDILDYDPATSSGHVLFGSGDGSPLTPYSGNEADIPDPVFKDQFGNTASSIASGGDFFATVNGNQITGFPDLLLVIDGQLVDEASADFSGGFQGVDQALLLSDQAPSGSGDWTGWTITSTLVGGMPALFARSGSGGPVYYYSATDLQNLAFGSTVQPVTLQLSGSPVLMQASDLTNDGTPDLWTVDATGTVTANILDLGATPPTLTAKTAQTLVTGTHAWPLQDGVDGTAATASDVTGSPAVNLTGAGAGATWGSGGLFDPDLTLDGTSTGYLHASTKALDLTNNFTVSVWAKPGAYGGAVFSQDGSADSGIKLVPTSSGWQLSLNTGSGTSASYDTVTGGTAHLGAWTRLTVSYDKAVKVMNLYVDDVFVATGNHTAPATGATGAFQAGDYQNSGARTGYFTGELSNLQVWAGTALSPTQSPGLASYHQAVTSTRILDTRTASGLTHTSGITAGTATVPANSITKLSIAGDAISGGTTSTVPDTVTAVAIDVTALNQSASGFVTAYADSTQRPVTSSTNFTASDTTTGYQIVPVGTDGKIDLYTHGSSVALVVDLTGYFTTDASLAGDQTYHPLSTATRALDTRTSVAHTNLGATGTVAAGTGFTLQITGISGVPADATAVAINLTTADATGSGYLQAYATGAAPVASTNLTYDTSSALASMAADTPIGSNGSITIYNHISATAVLVDISGYYTTDTSGQTYHAVNPTRLADTRNGTGGSASPIAANGTYNLSQATIQQITTATTPTLAIMLTDATATGTGFATAYPKDAPVVPGTSNLDWVSGAINANLALTPTNSTSEISIYNHSNGDLDLVVDCSGYFAA